MTNTPLGNMMVMYGIPPAPGAPGETHPRDTTAPWGPVPPFDYPGKPTTDAPVDLGGHREIRFPEKPAAVKPSPASVVMAITFIKRHFDLVLPPQDSRVQALAELLDLAFDVGASR